MILFRTKLMGKTNGQNSRPRLMHRPKSALSSQAGWTTIATALG
jgi:hypothetical protein